MVFQEDEGKEKGGDGNCWVRGRVRSRLGVDRMREISRGEKGKGSRQCQKKEERDAFIYKGM